MASYLFQLEPGEQLIFDEAGGWYKSKWQVHVGQIYLTNKRILFVKDPPPVFGLLSILFRKAGRQLTHDIPLTSVSQYHNEHFGVFKNIIVFSCSDGESFKFRTKQQYEVWDKKLKELQA